MKVDEQEVDILPGSSPDNCIVIDDEEEEKEEVKPVVELPVEVTGKRSREEYDSDVDSDTESDDTITAGSTPSPGVQQYMDPSPKRFCSPNPETSILVVIRDGKNSDISLEYKASTGSGKLKEEAREGGYRWFSYRGSLENPDSLEITLKTPRRFLSWIKCTTRLTVHGSNGYHFACHSLSRSKDNRDKFGNQLFEWIQNQDEYQDVKFAVIEKVATWMKKQSQTSYPTLEINDLFDCANLENLDWPLLVYLMSQVLMAFDCKEVVCVYPRNNTHYKNTLLYLSTLSERNESLAKLLEKSGDNLSPLERLLSFLSLRWKDNALNELTIESTELYRRIIKKFGTHQGVNEHPRQNKFMLVPKDHPHREELLQCDSTRESTSTTPAGAPEEWV